MNLTKTEMLPGLLNGVLGIAIILACFMLEAPLPIAPEAARDWGYFLVAAGMGLAAWATAYLRSAILGEVEPRLEFLVMEGPYRYIRHPVYLGMSVALLGVTLAANSWPGALGVFLLFLPSVVYRAKLEEEALSREFGPQWEHYRARTGFFLPLPGNDQRVTN